MKINSGSSPPQVIDAMLETSRECSRLVVTIEEAMRARVDAEERFEGAYYKKMIGYMDNDEMNITSAKAKVLTHDNIRELKKSFEIAKGVEDVLRKKLRALETAVEGLRSVLSFMKNDMGRGV